MIKNIVPVRSPPHNPALNHTPKAPMCVASHVHISTARPLALAAPMQQLNALHRQVTGTHPVISLMNHIGDDIN